MLYSIPIRLLVVFTEWVGHCMLLAHPNLAARLPLAVFHHVIIGPI